MNTQPQPPVASPLSWRVICLALLAIVMVFVGLPGKTQATRHVSTPPTSNAIPSSDEIYLMPWRIIAPPSAVPMIEMKNYTVDVSVKDNLATTTIEQTFVNKSNRTLEAKYLYPLPQDANFSSFTLTINGKAVEGKIMEKDKARKTYTEIVRKLIDPGLLEYIDDRTVQASVAPILPNETKKIQLSYTQLLAQDGGLYKYQYALGATENLRNLPQEATLKVQVETRQPLKTLYSPSHSPKVERSGDKRGVVTQDLKTPGALAQKHFVMYFSQDNQTISLNSLAYKPSGSEDGFFLLTLRSPLSVKTKETLPKEIVLVMDTSGSMSGNKIVQAREALTYIVNHLQPEDRFNIVEFNTDVRTFQPEMMPATQQNIDQALAFVSQLRATGSTNIEQALQVSFGQLTQASDRPKYVIFLTDGEPTVGITDTQGLLAVAKKANTQNARLFNFGVGYDVKTILLSKLAADHHGSTTFVEPDENLEVALTGFYNKIMAPVLTDVALQFKNLTVDRIYPSDVGDLFAGSEVILLGRFKQGGDGSVVLTGKNGKETQTFNYPLKWKAAEQSQHAYLPRLWAGRRIGTLLDAIRQNGEHSEQKDEIIQLSKTYGIVTPYTSFLAMEPQEQELGLPTHRRRPSVMSPQQSPAPRGSMEGFKADRGAGAVRAAKALNKIQQQSSAQDLADAQFTGSTASQSSRLQVQTVASKTFVLKDQVWTDTAYDEKQQTLRKSVTFGTAEYFQLLQDVPELAKFFSLGSQVVVVLNGIAYEVLPPQAS